MALPPEKIKQIESDANIAYPINSVYPSYGSRGYLVEAYTSGATAEAEKAAKLVEALGRMIPLAKTAKLFDEERNWIEQATEALTNYKSTTK